MSQQVYSGLFAFALVALLSSSAFCAQSLQKISTEYVLSDFSADSKPAWWLTSLTPKVGASKFESGILSCDFSEGPGYIGISGGSPFIIGDPEEVTLTFVSDGSGHPIILRMMDSGWQFFQREIAVMDTAGVRTVAVPLADMPTWYHFGGPADGVVRRPIKPWEIIVDRDGPNASVKMIEIKAKTHVTIEQGIDLQLVSRTQDDTRDVLTVQCMNILPWDARGRCSWKVTDLHGTVLDSGVDDIQLAAGSRIERTLNVGREGVKLCEFTLNARIPLHEIEGQTPKPLKEGKDGSSDLLKTSVPVVKSLSTSVVSDRMPRRPGNLLPDSHFGMGMYLGQRYPVSEMEKPAQMARDIGIKWSREEFNWGHLEPERGKWRWEVFDAAVETYYRNGISIFGLLCYWSPWTKPYTEEGIQDYCNYVRAVVGRYKDRVKHWEIWNEPNIFFWGGTVEQHADLLKAAYDAVKEADPEAKVIACSTSGTDLKFIERIFELGCFDKMDILSIHPYRAPTSPEKSDFIGEMKRADALVRKYGDPKEIWITEIGWPTNIGPNGSTDQRQAAIMARCYIQAIASGVVQKTFWYDYRNDGTDPLYHEHNFGILRRDLIPKPSYIAFGVMTRYLEGKRYVKDISPDKDVYAYVFEGRGGRCIAAWCTSGQRELTISGQNSSVSLADLAGEKQALRPSGGRVSVRLSEYPQFITRVNDNVKVGSTPVTAGEASVDTPPRISAYPLDAQTLAVELHTAGQSSDSATVSVRIPGYADVFSMASREGQPHIETYHLPESVVLGSEQPVPVTVIYDTPSHVVTKESNVYYVPCGLSRAEVAIDGSLDEWPEKPNIRLNAPEQMQALQGSNWQGTDDLSAEVWVMWDRKAFHLAARVRDDVFHQDEVEGETWRGDSIQFALDPSHAAASGLGNIYEIMIAQTRDGPQAYLWAAPDDETGIIGEAALAVKREDGLTSYELSIPLSAIPQFKPSPGRTIGFSIIVNDNDGKGRKGWAQWTDGIGWQKNPSLYGDLTFVE